MTTKNTAAVEAAEELTEEQKRIQARFEAAGASLNNKDRRTAVRVFESDWEDLDEMDLTVVMVWIAEGRSKPLEDYDAMPIADLEKVMSGE